MATARRPLRGRLLLAGAGGAVLMLIALLMTLDTLPAFSDLGRGAAQLQAAAKMLGTEPAGWSPSRADAAERLNHAADLLLQSSGASLDRNPWLSLAAPLPLVGDQVRTLRHLAAAGRAAARSLDDLVVVARAYQAAKSDPAPPGPRLLRMVAASSAPLADAQACLDPVLATLRLDARHPLLPPLRATVQRAVAVLGAAQARAASGAAVARYAPLALGEQTPHTYVLLMANPAELRPAGGFWGAAGTITFDHATPKALTIQDQRHYDVLSRQRFAPPEVMTRYLTFYRRSLEVGDAGWDPDFPTSAHLVEQMFAAARQPPLDGTIAIDPYAISALLRLTGPVRVRGYAQPFTPETFFPSLNHLINVAGANKDVLGPIGTAILRQVVSQPVSAWPRLLQVLQEQAESRHILIESHDPTLAAALHAARWDGSLLAGDGDYLMAVDANVGGNKTDYYTRKTMSLKVEIDPSGMSRHQLVLHYELPLPADADDRALNPGAGLYKDYLRVYLPETAKVVALRVAEDGRPIVGGLDQVTYAHGLVAAATYLELRRGHHLDVTLDYTVPLDPGRGYRLYLQKQAGIPELPTTIQVSDASGVSTDQALLRSDEEVTAK